MKNREYLTTVVFGMSSAIMAMMTWGLWFGANHAVWVFDNLNQVLYASGKVLITPYGGLFLEILIAIFVIAAAKTKSNLLILSWGCFWLGVIIFNWGFQIDDVRTKLLETLNQNVNEWEVVLKSFDLLASDHTIARIFTSIGSLTVITGIVISIVGFSEAPRSKLRGILS